MAKSYERDAEGSEPRKLRRVDKRKPKADKRSDKSISKAKIHKASGNKIVSAKSKRRNRKYPVGKPKRNEGLPMPLYARYKATIKDPKHFYVSQVKFDGGLSGEEKAYLYFNSPLSDSDKRGLLHRSRVEILEPGYKSIRIEDMKKVNAVDSQISWIYNDKEKLFHRFKVGGTGIAKDAGKTPNEVDTTRRPNDDASEPESVESPTNAADDVDASPVEESSGGNITEGNSASSNTPDEDYASAPEATDSPKDSNDEPSISGTNETALSTTEDGEPINNADATNIDDGKSTEASTEESDTDEPTTNIANTSVPESPSTGSKQNRKKDGGTKGSYELVDEDGNPVDRAQYKEAIDDEIASEPKANDSAVLTGYRPLDPDDIDNAAPDVPNTAINTMTEGGNNAKRGASKSPNKRRRRRNQASLWPRRRIQNEVVRAKRKVSRLEQRLGQAETKLDTVIRI